MKARFGTAGRPDSFAAMGYKKITDIPRYLQQFGLHAFEYQCGRGVRVNEAAVTELGRLCREQDLALSLHAPYYISLSSIEADKRENSIRYILESARAAHLMGADRIVVHSGSCGKIAREAALSLAKDTLSRALSALDNEGLGNIHLCPETMGKVNQLGTLDEVLSLCTLDERLIPCVDFGHLYARDFGMLQDEAGYRAILDRIADRLGNERLQQIHVHFSKIAYTVPGGEKCHLNFSDEGFGPPFEPLLMLVLERGMTPRFISESAGMQAEDAAAMQSYYLQIKGAT